MGSWSSRKIWRAMPEKGGDRERAREPLILTISLRQLKRVWTTFKWEIWRRKENFVKPLLLTSLNKKTSPNCVDLKRLKRKEMTSQSQTQFSLRVSPRMPPTIESIWKVLSIFKMLISWISLLVESKFRFWIGMMWIRFTIRITMSNIEIRCLIRKGSRDWANRYLNKTTTWWPWWKIEQPQSSLEPTSSLHPSTTSGPKQNRRITFSNRSKSKLECSSCSNWSLRIMEFHWNHLLAVIHKAPFWANSLWTPASGISRAHPFLSHRSFSSNP